MGYAERRKRIRRREELFRSLRAFILAEECLYCGKPVGCGAFCLCRECVSYLKDLSAEERYIAGCPLLIAYEYGEQLRPAVHNFKYRADRTAGCFLAGAVCDMLEKRCEKPFDIITGVPRNRNSERRFCQAEYLAKKTALYTGSAFSAELLVKRRNIKSQTRCEGKNERIENVKGAYKLACNADIKGKRILLIDDVTTSGATMAECAAQLTGGGAEVVCAAAAKPLSPGKETIPLRPGRGYYVFSENSDKNDKEGNVK